MKIPDATIVKLLKGAKKATDETLAPIQEKAKKDKTTLREAVVKSSLISEVDIIKLYADEIGVPFTDCLLYTSDAADE